MRSRSSRWNAVRRTLGLVFLLLFVGAVGFDFPWFQGSPLFTRSFGWLPLLDPLVAAESLLTSGRLSTEALAAVGILVVVAALLGPVFCGWVCPLGQILDWNDALREKVLAFWRRKTRRRVRPVFEGRSPPRGLRDFVLGGTLAFSFVLGVPVFVALSPINLVVRALATGAVVGLAWLAGLCVLEWFVPRAWCRMLCPLGALYAALGRFARLRVRIDPARAGKLLCALCSRNCTMGIRVMEDYTTQGKAAIDDPACTRCGACLDSCPNRVLHLGFRDMTGGGIEAGVCGEEHEATDPCQGLSAGAAQPSSSASAQSRS